MANHNRRWRQDRRQPRGSFFGRHPVLCVFGGLFGLCVLSFVGCCGGLVFLGASASSQGGGAPRHADRPAAIKGDEGREGDEEDAAAAGNDNPDRPRPEQRQAIADNQQDRFGKRPAPDRLPSSSPATGSSAKHSGGGGHKTTPSMDKPVNVHDYTRRDGTHVQQHTRELPGHGKKK